MNRRMCATDKANLIYVFDFCCLLQKSCLRHPFNSLTAALCPRKETRLEEQKNILPGMLPLFTTKSNKVLEI